MNVGFLLSAPSLSGRLSSLDDGISVISPSALHTVLRL
jgi:hypothetical protein